MKDVTVYNTEGKKTGNIELPESLFGQAWNADLVHEVVVSMMGNARGSTAHTKDRSEVRGGGRKPWRQKGTGRARHGSRRSPIWRGGGITFGPRSEKDYSRKINKKARAKALAITLSKKLADGEVAFIDTMSFSQPKAKDAKTMLKALDGVFGNAAALSGKRKNAALIVLTSRDENTEKSFQNFGNVLVMQAKDINPVGLLTYRHVLFVGPKEAVDILTARIGEGEVKAPKKAEKASPAKKPAAKTTKKPAAKKPAAKKNVKK